MKPSRTRSRGRVLDFDPCEDRTLTTLIFVFNGNAFAAAGPNPLTASAARVLQGAGNQVVQLSNPALSTPGAFSEVVRQVASVSHGQPIGIVGFSAGGALAARLSSVASLRVVAALDYYGPPDLRDYLHYHHGDQYARYVLGHASPSPAGIDLLSGPSHSSAHVVGAFGMNDHNVVASESTAGFQRDYPGSRVYYYPGGHGASLDASPSALEDFLNHLAPH